MCSCLKFLLKVGASILSAVLERFYPMPLLKSMQQSSFHVACSTNTHGTILLSSKTTNISKWMVSREVAGYVLKHEPSESNARFEMNLGLLRDCSAPSETRCCRLQFLRCTIAIAQSFSSCYKLVCACDLSAFALCFSSGYRLVRTCDLARMSVRMFEPKLESKFSLAKTGSSCRSQPKTWRLHNIFHRQYIQV